MKMASMTQQVCIFLFNLTQNTHARQSLGITVDRNAVWQQGDAQFAYFVLEQFAQWLQQFQTNCSGQAADVVVALNGDGFSVARAAS